LKLLDPSVLELLKFSEDLRFKAPKDAAVRSLYLSIGLRVGHCGPSYVDLLFATEVENTLPVNWVLLSVMIVFDHDPILVYDLLDELDCCL